jgi:2-polyprenyl-3-methyl-5-hydroxy-6-metoxy-1,4-benzoquinol methylase
MDFLKDKPADLFEYLLKDYLAIHPNIDADKARRLVKTDETFQRLTIDWYRYLNDNDMENAFSVYNDDYYFIDIFNCFTTYSRDYIKRVIKSSAYNELMKCKSFIDIGCGVSFSTCSLKQTFPHMKGYAVNLKDTKQWKFCEVMAKRHHFKLIDDFSNIGQIDIVFASEFFEHILDPIEYVDNVLTKLKPKYLIIANSFNTWSIGHYEKYSLKSFFGDIIVPQDRMSKLFNDHMRNENYIDLDCEMWNNKPKIWKKVV